MIAETDILISDLVLAVVTAVGLITAARLMALWATLEALCAPMTVTAIS
jgi:hypothetical protein